jgi:outer membrane protein assembly factor BamB
MHLTKRHRSYLASLLLSGAALAAAAQAFDWPQWQGPDRNAISKETGLLKEWPKDGPPLAWKNTHLGGGYSAPSIAAGKIYGMSRRGDDEVVWALAEADGKELWATPIGHPPAQRMSQGQEGPGCTPTVDGERIYVISNGGELACLALDGKIIWQKSFTRDFGGTPPMWVYRESPLIDGDKVIATPGAPDALMVALDKTSGNTIWKTKAPEPSNPQPTGPGPGRGRGGFPQSGAAYASAIAVDFEGQRQYVQLTAKALIGVSASDGKLLWQYAKPANRAAINCTTPLYNDGKIFASSAYGAGGGLVKLTRDTTGGIKAEEVWFTQKMQNHHGGVILLDGCLYGANGGNEGGALVCLDFATGEVLWNERNKHRAPKGAITLADGRLYYRCEDGVMLLIEPNSKQYIERGRFPQPDRTAAPAWSHPIISNGKMYLRDQDLLFCYDVKSK